MRSGRSRICIWAEYQHRAPGGLFIALRFPSHELTRSQLVDDILDLSTAPGKPGSGADPRLHLATGPVLYAAAELVPLIARGSKHDGDVERVSLVQHCFFFSLGQRRSHQALSLILASFAISRTHDLAQTYAEKAREVLGVLLESEAREALEALTDGVVRARSSMEATLLVRIPCKSTIRNRNLLDLLRSSHPDLSSHCTTVLIECT